MIANLRNMLRDDSASVIAEYALIVATMSLVMLAAIQIMEAALTSEHDSVATGMTNAELQGL